MIDAAEVERLAAELRDAERSATAANERGRHDDRLQAGMDVGCNSSAARVVIGSFATIDTVDPDTVTVEFSNGHDVRRGVGANSMGNPCAAIAWLARSLRAEGTGLVAGQVVFTGGLTAPFDVRTGERYTLSSAHLPPAHTTARAH